MQKNPKVNWFHANIFLKDVIECSKLQEVSQFDTVKESMSPDFNFYHSASDMTDLERDLNTLQQIPFVIYRLI